MVNVVFLHPDLGIGGAERAIVDAALALKHFGHSVHIVTAHHDKSHCFQETKDGTINVTAVGDWLPRSILGKCYALCAYFRMIYAAIYLIFFSDLKYQVVFCDQISACIPVLTMGRAKILFYCHFPDMLLTKRETFLKALYRRPLDWLEETTTGMADCILVNSKFTGTIFRETFKSLHQIEPRVLYPIPDFNQFNKKIEEPTEDYFPMRAKTVFLSINRYERKKNILLAIKALGEIKDRLKDISNIALIVAGGYDERVTENREYYLELRKCTEDLGLTDNVVFIRSFSDAQKLTLLHHSDCLIYTPDREHFGIVPIEAMYMKCPVIAVNTGGPLETVAHKETGFLCKSEPREFADAMEKFINDIKLSQKMGEYGHRRVVDKFSFDAFASQLNGIINDLCIQTPGL